jgi:hypothetical protein
MNPTRLLIVVLAALAALAGATLAAWPPTASASIPGVYLSRTCSADTGALTVTLAWQAYNQFAVEQWVDVSTVSSEWEPGSYWGIGPLHPAVGAFAWDGAEANTLYFLRINQKLSDGSWTASPTLWVQTGACAASAPSPAPDYALPPVAVPSVPLCHPSYSVCLLEDVDDYSCAGDKDADPPYVYGPVLVKGDDRFDLDRNKDGIGCGPGDIERDENGG